MPDPASRPGRAGRRLRVLGVDACPSGWVGIALQAGGPAARLAVPGAPGPLGPIGPPAPAAPGAPGAAPRGFLAATIAALVDAAVADGPLDAIAIDIPIGVPDRGRRQADEQARRALGRRWPSVFLTPVRAALIAPDRASADTANRAAGAGGLAAQAYALRASVLDVDGWVRTAPCPVVEAHPELCFATMNGGPLDTRKATWAGAAQRVGLLAASGIVLPADLGPAGRGAGVADVLDAAAVAWTAGRYARGLAVSRPDPPELMSDGWPAAIWA